MGRAASPSVGRRYGLVRACRVLEIPRSTVYAARARRLAPSAPRKRGPQTAWTDAELTDLIRAVLAGSLFIGENGRVLVDRSGWSIVDRDGNPVEKPASARLVGSAGGPSNHQTEWLQCLRTRQQPRSDISSMHQTTTVCHLANLAYLRGGAIEWDAAKETVKNDTKAMDLLPYQRPYRQPWSLPKI